MVQNLIVMNSSYVGSRDLWWMDDPEAIKGYSIYRAFDHPVNWTKLNANPWSGHFYRDQVTLEQVSYIVQDSDWRDKGTMGRWGFQIPEVPYADVLTGRPFVATNPDSVQVFLDGVEFRPAEIQGLDRTVWLQVDNTLKQGGYVSDLAPVNDGVVWKADYSGVNEFKVVYNKLANYVDIYSGMTRTFYTIVPLGASGEELHKPGAHGSKIVNTQEVDEMTWEYAEMVRRNQWLFEQVGEPSYVFFRKTRGEICGCRGAETGLGQPRTGCKICFEVGIVGGYYGPYDITYVPPDSAITRELDEGGGIKATRESLSYLTNTPIVQDGDLIVRRTGDRLVIHGVTYKSPRGVLLQQDFTTQLLPWGDTRYLIPLNSGLPTLYNPIVENNHLQGDDPLHLVGNGEPIVDARVILEGQTPWENKAEIPIGRSVTFSKIQR
jgi:hypothetical protein